MLISRKMEEAAWERTRRHLGNLEHWRLRLDMEQKGKYRNVEDAAGPLLMGRDAAPSVMKRGLYLDGRHARSGDLSLKKKKKRKISRKSHGPGFRPLRCLSGNHPFSSAASR